VFDTDVNILTYNNILTKDFTFRIKAIAKGGAETFRTIVAKIVICGFE